MNKERNICGVKVFVSGETYNNYKGTLEEQLEQKDKEIERLNKKYENAVADYEEQKYIINELEKWLDNNSRYKELFECDRYYQEILNKLKELKGNNEKD